MNFLSSTIPENGTIVVPSQAVRFSQQSILQYFLMPRGVIHCGCNKDPQFYSTRCIECLRDYSNYVPAIGEFPSNATMEGYKEFVPHTIDSYLYHGVYAPIAQDIVGFQSRKTNDYSLTTAFVIDLVICGLFFYLGFQITSIIFHGHSRHHAVIAGIPIGVGTLTWVIFLASWAGVPLSLGSIVVIYIALIITVSMAKRFLLTKVHNPGTTFSIQSLLSDDPLPRAAFIATFLLLALLLGMGIVISVGRGYSLYDGIVNWATKGYGIALEGSVYAGQKWGGHHLEYPQNIHIMIAIFKFADGDILPGSKLILPLFHMSLLFGCYIALRGQRVPPTVALIGLLTLFSIPMIFKHETIGWGNFIFTTYIVLGAIYFSEGIANHKTDRQILGGLLLAFATWTRPEGIVSWAALIIGSTVGLRLLRRRVSLTKWLLLTVLIPASYLFFSSGFLQSGEIGVTLKRFFESFTNGTFSLQPLSFLLGYSWRKLSYVRDWGYILPVVIFLGIVLVGTLKKRKIEPNILTYIIATGITILIPLAIFFVAYTHKANHYTGFLNMSFNRAMMPAVILTFLTLLMLTSDHQNTAAFWIATGDQSDFDNRLTESYRRGREEEKTLTRFERSFE